MIGTELGHYRVLGKLGEGGMGQVYAAEDTKLGRRVALKVLPADMASDPERLARFEREARVVAALNHPNIVTIYSVEEALGIRFLTMELVEGKTLGDLIPKNGLPLEDLLRLAVPLVDAVASAHQHGIVHRDLKPANVMIAADGRLKVLDFGLAKLKAQQVAPTDSTYVATQSLTQGHAIVGTAAYMSPEQAEGRPVDHRSDIFSLGVVLYEMACGRQPFEGDTVFSVISSIIKDTPAPVSAVNRAAPLALERVVTRALAKNPAERYPTAVEMRDDLQQVREQAASVRVVSSLVRAVVRSRWTRRVALAVALVAVLAGAAWYLLWRTPAGGPTLGMRFTRLTADPGVEQFPSLTPDGKWVVYAGQKSGNMDIYLLSTSGQNPKNLTEDPAEDDEPAVSPDGEHIAFRSSRDGGGIFLMGLTGESPKRVTPAGVSAAFNPAWSPDGADLVYATENVQLTPLNGEGKSALWVVNVNTSQIRDLKVEDGVQPSWSPHRYRIAYTVRLWLAAGRDLGSRAMDIYTIPAAGGSPVALTDDSASDWSPAWAPDGRSVYFVSDRGGSMNLWRIAVDERSGKPLGKPEPIMATAPFLAHPSVSADGLRVAYSSKIETQNIQRLAFNPVTVAVEGQPAPVTNGSRLWSDPDPTPDGERVVFYSRDQPEGDLYVCRPDGTGQRSLTSDEFQDRVPRWSPDKNWVAFFSSRGGPLSVFKIRPDGSDVQHVVEGTIPAWSPDGSQLAASHAVALPAPGLTEVVATGGPASTPAREQLPEPEQALRPFIAIAWSPDGASLAGQRGFSDRGAPGVILYSFASRTYQRLTDFGEWPAWLDGRRLLFVSKGKEFWVVDTRTKQARQVYSTVWDVLGPPRLTRDGRTIFFSRRETEADIYLLSFEAADDQSSTKAP